jgi:asparagine synthase (glutamine-hydrolysing)
MPGVMGILTNRPTGGETARLNTMIGSMGNGSFLRHGSFVDEARGIFIGYTVPEGSFADCMPIRNETGEILLFLTGEVYPDRDAVVALKARGHEFAAGDASYLVHLFEEDEAGFFSSLNGWFNGVVVDLARDRAMIFNDRFGMRRLYYADLDGGMMFASEAKALLAADPALRRLHHRGVGEYLVYDCVLGNRTFFENVRLIPPASVWRWTKSGIHKASYHDPAALEAQPELAPGEFAERFIGTFKSVVPRYFSGGRAGLSLTGGLDTRSILAVSKPAPGELPCYTFGGSSRDIYDVRFAPLVARAAGQPHQILSMDIDQYLKDYPDIVERMIYLSDGLGSVVQADMLYFNQRARDVSPVRITGKYGSQVLKKVLGFQDRSPYDGLPSAEFAPRLEEARETVRKLPKDNAFSFFLHVELPWLWNGILSVESSQVDVRSPFLDNDLIRLAYQAPPLDKLAGERIQLELIGRFNPALLKVPSTSAHRGSAPYFMRKLQKAMTIADKLYIRERLPYGLTHKVAKIDRVVRHLHVDRWLIGRTEFRRYRTWFRDQLSPYLRDILTSSRAKGRPFWDHAVLSRLLEDHIAGRGTYLREIRKALQLELIARTFVD